MANAERPDKHKYTFSFDLRLIVIVLLLVIAGMLASWRPWAVASGGNARTIEVTGEAKLTAEPDEFVFYPAYEVKNADKQAAINSLSAKSTEIVAKLKSLGVADNKIKTDTSGYDNTFYGFPEKQQDPVYSLRFTITVSSRETAQKIQDYLNTTAPIGSISPQASFSDTRRKELENKARDQATKEARTKAEQSARNLDFRVGKVKSIKDGAGFGDVVPLGGREIAVDSAFGSSPKLGVHPGENELRYSVTVTYFVK